MNPTPLEAMGTALPVIATAVGGNPEVVANGETGLNVLALAARAMAEAMEKLARDRELRRAMGVRGRARGRPSPSVARWRSTYRSTTPTRFMHGRVRATMKRAHVPASPALFRTPHERVRAPFTGEFLRLCRSSRRSVWSARFHGQPDVEWRAAGLSGQPLDVPAHAQVDGVDVCITCCYAMPPVSGSIQAVMEAWAAYPAVLRIHQQRPGGCDQRRFIYLTVSQHRSSERALASRSC